MPKSNEIKTKICTTKTEQELKQVLTEYEKFLKKLI